MIVLFHALAAAILLRASIVLCGMKCPQYYPKFFTPINREVLVFGHEAIKCKICEAEIKLQSAYSYYSDVVRSPCKKFSLVHIECLLKLHCKPNDPDNHNGPYFQNILDYRCACCQRTYYYGDLVNNIKACIKINSEKSNLLANNFIARIVYDLLRDRYYHLMLYELVLDVKELGMFKKQLGYWGTLLKEHIRLYKGGDKQNSDSQNSDSQNSDIQNSDIQNSDSNMNDQSDTNIMYYSDMLHERDMIIDVTLKFDGLTDLIDDFIDYETNQEMASTPEYETYINVHKRILESSSGKFNVLEAEWEFSSGINSSEYNQCYIYQCNVFFGHLEKSPIDLTPHIQKIRIGNDNLPYTLVQNATQLFIENRFFPTNKLGLMRYLEFILFHRLFSLREYLKPLFRLFRTLSDENRAFSRPKASGECAGSPGLLSILIDIVSDYSSRNYYNEIDHTANNETLKYAREKWEIINMFLEEMKPLFTDEDLEEKNVLEFIKVISVSSRLSEHIEHRLYLAPFFSTKKMSSFVNKVKFCGNIMGGRHPSVMEAIKHLLCSITSNDDIADFLEYYKMHSDDRDEIVNKVIFLDFCTWLASSHPAELVEPNILEMHREMLENGNYKQIMATMYSFAFYLFKLSPMRRQEASNAILKRSYAIKKIFVPTYNLVKQYLLSNQTASRIGLRLPHHTIADKYLILLQYISVVIGNLVSSDIEHALSIFAPATYSLDLGDDIRAMCSDRLEEIWASGCSVCAEYYAVSNTTYRLWLEMLKAFFNSAVSDELVRDTNFRPKLIRIVEASMCISDRAMYLFLSLYKRHAKMEEIVRIAILNETLKHRDEYGLSFINRANGNTPDEDENDTIQTIVDDFLDSTKSKIMLELAIYRLRRLMKRENITMESISYEDYGKLFILSFFIQ